MEQSYDVPLDKVFALLTDPKWLAARRLSLGEISARKVGGGIRLTTKRRVRRRVRYLVAYLGQHGRSLARLPRANVACAYAAADERRADQPL